MGRGVESRRCAAHLIVLARGFKDWIFRWASEVSVAEIKNSVIAELPSVLERATRENLVDCIGNTPLLRLRRVSREFRGIEFHAKAEWFNPGGSVKDRAALRMILDGERRGELSAGKTILDSTSGNTGIAYAMIGAARGYRVKLCLPANA